MSENNQFLSSQRSESLIYNPIVLGKRLQKLAKFFQCEANNANCACKGFEKDKDDTESPDSLQTTCRRCFHSLSFHLKHLEDAKTEEISMLFQQFDDLKTLSKFFSSEDMDAKTKNIYWELFNIIYESFIHIKKPHFEEDPPFENPNVMMLLKHFTVKKFCHLNVKDLKNMYNVATVLLPRFLSLKCFENSLNCKEQLSEEELWQYELNYKRYLQFCVIPKVCKSLKKYEPVDIFGYSFLKIEFSVVKDSLLKSVAMTKVLEKQESKIRDTLRFLEALEEEIFNEQSPLWKPDFIPTITFGLRRQIMEDEDKSAVASCSFEKTQKGKNIAIGCSLKQKQEDKSIASGSSLKNNQEDKSVTTCCSLEKKQEEDAAKKVIVKSAVTVTHSMDVCSPEMLVEKSKISCSSAFNNSTQNHHFDAEPSCKKLDKCTNGTLLEKSKISCSSAFDKSTQNHHFDAEPSCKKRDKCTNGMQTENFVKKCSEIVTESTQTENFVKKCSEIVTESTQTENFEICPEMVTESTQTENFVTCSEMVTGSTQTILDIKPLSKRENYNDNDENDASSSNKTEEKADREEQSDIEIIEIISGTLKSDKKPSFSVKKEKKKKRRNKIPDDDVIFEKEVRQPFAVITLSDDD